jgi:hypothetical protein
LQRISTDNIRDSHVAFRATVRKFFDENVVPEALASEEPGKVPSSELYQKLGSQLSCLVL